MKTLTYSGLLALVLCIVASRVAQAQKLVNLSWEQTAGNLDPSIQWNASTVAPNGDLISVSNTFHVGQGVNVLIIKYDDNGNLIWQEEYNHNNSSIDFGTDVILDSDDNIYICGATQSSSTTPRDYLILKYDQNGGLEWSETYDGSAQADDVASSMTIDDVDEIYITGLSQSSGADYDYATAKYDEDGVEQWVSRYDRNGYDDIPVKILFNEELGIDITGGSGESSTDWDYVSVRYDSDDGDQINEGIIGNQGFGFDKPVDMVLDSIGNMYITGTSSQNGVDYEITTIKIDTGFQLVWTQDYGYLNEEDGATSIAIDSNDDIYVGGFVGEGSGKRSILIKYNNAGTLDWKIETPENDTNMSIISDVKVNDANEIILLREEDRGSNYIWALMSVDSTGQTLWGIEHEVNPTTIPQPRQIHILSNDTIYFHAVSEDSSQSEVVTVLLATLKDRPLAVHYNTQNEPYQVKNELIIRFAPSVVDTNFINNTSLTYGTVSNVITSTSLISSLDGIFNSNGDIGNWTLLKMHPHLTTQKTTGTSRLGSTFTIPKLWSEMILMIPETLTTTENVNDEWDWGEDISALPRDKIIYAYADLLGQLQTNDPEFNNQRSLQSTDFPNGDMNVEAAWNFMGTSPIGIPSVVVGIMDEGIYSNHLDLGAGSNLGGLNGSVVDGGWNFTTSNPTPILSTTAPENDHGTKVAGVIAALRNNQLGIAGIAGGNSNEGGTPTGGVHLYSMFLPFNCCGLTNMVKTSRVKSAFVLAATGGSGNSPLFDIMNNSWGFSIEISGPGDPLTTSMVNTLRDGVRIAHDAEIIIVNSRGNNITLNLFNGDEDVYPATFQDDWGISVGGATEGGERFSSRVSSDGFVNSLFLQSYFGKNMDVLAPCIRYVQNYPTSGVNTDMIRTLSTPPNNIDYFGATSAAAAHASGVVALMQSYSETDLAPEDAEHLLEYGATDGDYDDINSNLPIAVPGYDNESGWGMLNALASIECLEPGFSGVVQYNSQPTLGSEQMVSSNATIYLAYDYEIPSTGTIIPEGVYNGVKAYKYTKNKAHLLNSTSYLYAVDTERPGYWVRNSASNLWDFPTGSGTLLVTPDANVSFNQATITDATLEGYYIELTHNGQTYTLPEGAKTNPRFAWSLLVRNDSGTLPLDEELESKNSFECYPNPTKDNLTTRFSLPSRQKATLSLLSIQGQVLWQHSDEYLPGKYEVHIDISNFSSGMYQVSLQTTNGIKSVRIIKQ